MSGIWNIVKAMAMWNMIKEIMRNFWAWGCAGVFLAVVLGSLFLCLASWLLALLGWIIAVQWVVNRRSWGNVLLFVTLIASLCMICVPLSLHPQGPETLEPAWQAIWAVGFVYLYLGGLIIGIESIATDSQKKKGDSKESKDQPPKEPVCPSCGCKLRGDTETCRWCGANLVGRLARDVHSAHSARANARRTGVAAHKGSATEKELASMANMGPDSALVGESTGVVGTGRAKKFAEKHKKSETARKKGFLSTVQVLKNAESTVEKVCTEYSEALDLELQRLQDEREDTGEAEIEFSMRRESGPPFRVDEVEVVLTLQDGRVDLTVRAYKGSVAGPERGIYERTQSTEQDVADLIEEAYRFLV